MARQGDARRTRDTPEQRAIRRKGRLVMRQVEVLRRPVALSASSPVLDDAIGAWLPTVSVRRLRVAGVCTLADLLLLIRVHGYRWYRKVPRIGELVARRLVTWLGHHEQTLGPVAATALCVAGATPAVDNAAPALAIT